MNVGGNREFQILLVEDVDGDAELVVEYVLDLGDGEFVLTRVSTLADACEQMATGHFDVVLLDLSLPDSPDARNTVREICRHYDNNSPSIVILTGTDDPDIASAALSDCAHNFLLKSDITPKSLMRAIQIAVRRHSQMRLGALNKQKLGEGDGREAFDVLKRVNRMMPPDAAAGVGPTVGDLATASSAVEIVVAGIGRKLDETFAMLRQSRGDIADLTYRLRQLEGKLHTQEVGLAEIVATIKTNGRRIRSMNRLLKGGGQLPALTTRVERLEDRHRSWLEQRDERVKTVRDMFVQFVPQVLISIGVAVISFLGWYISQRK